MQRVVVEGVLSDASPVVSGVPQGSELGPCLFLFYINDIAVGLQSTVRLFADDTMLYLTIKKADAILTTVVYDDAYFLFSRRLTDL